MFDQTFYDNTASTWPAMFVIGLMFLGLIAALFLVLGLFWLKRRLSRPELYGMSREQVQKQWQKVLEVSGQGEMGQKLAVIEADKLLDAALKSIVMPGNTLGERLKMACYKYPKLKDVWWAHKLRNNIVHDHSYELRGGEAKKALAEFEDALKVLNIL